MGEWPAWSVEFCKAQKYYKKNCERSLLDLRSFGGMVGVSVE